MGSFGPRIGPAKGTGIGTPIGLAAVALGLAAGALICVVGAANAAAATLEGRYVVRHSDSPRTNGARHLYGLQVARTKFVRLDFAGARASATRSRSRARPGDRVRVSGKLQGRRLKVGARGLRVRGDRRARASVSGARKVAVVLANFQNDARTPWSVDSVRNAIFGSGFTSNTYFQEGSGGSLSLTGKYDSSGDVFGWYTIDYDNSPCSWGNWADAALSAADAEPGVSLSGYDHLVLIVPYVSSCGFAGLAYLGGDFSMMNGTTSVGVVAHELGHNLILHHASSLNCTSGGQRVTISGSCTLSEYGDPFDIMGASYKRHFSGWHKTQVGFLPQSHTQTVTTDGTYTLAPSEQSLQGQVQQIRIPRTTSGDYVVDYYALDYRRPFGTLFDDFTSTDPAVTGVTLRIVRAYGVIERTKLLDATPETTTFSDAPLQPGASFHDPTKDLRVTTLSSDSFGASVQIDSNASQSEPDSGGGSGDDSGDPGDEDPGTDEPLPPPDDDGPELELAVRTLGQVRLRGRSLASLQARCNFDCELEVDGYVMVGGSRLAIQPDFFELYEDEATPLRLRLSRKRAARLARSLRAGRRASARVRLAAYDEYDDEVRRTLRFGVTLARR